MTAPLAPPQDLDAEMAVLGAVLLSDSALQGLIEENLRPEHFYRESHGRVYQAMLDVALGGGSVDRVTLIDRLRSDGALEAVGGPGAVDLLAGPVPGVGNFRQHARIVKDRHYERLLLSGAYQLQAAVHTADRAMMQDALQALAIPDDDRRAATSTPVQLAERAYSRYEDSDVEVFPLPLDRLNALLAGGPRRGDYVGLGGYTSHGKSVYCDQWLEECVRRGFKANLYLTEMTEDERVDRVISRLANVPLHVIRSRSFTEKHRTSVLKALPEIPFHITSAHDWTSEEIRRHIEFSDFDAVAIDTLHDIQRPADLGEEPGLRHVSSQLRAAAKSKGQERALLAVIHLNDSRVEDYPKLPVNRDIRGSGMIVRHLDTVVMVWQKPNDNKEPAGEGVIRITKARQGELGSVGAYFSGSRVRWEGLYVVPGESVA